MLYDNQEPHQKNSSILTTKRYAIVLDTEEDGTRTLEDYDTAEQALAAFESIRANGYHIPENYSDIDMDKITFENREFTTLTMDVEVWDEKMNPIGFDSIEHTPILMFNGRVIMPVPKTSKETMDFLHESALGIVPKLENTISEIDAWKDGLRGMLVGSNTMICTLNNEGRIFHVVANNSLKIAEEVDGHLTGVDMYSPEVAAKAAKGIKLHGEGAPGLTVQPVNMSIFQEEMRSRAENMLKSNVSLLKYFQIQDLVSKTPIGGDLKSAIKSLSASKINLKV